MKTQSKLQATLHRLPQNLVSRKKDNQQIILRKSFIQNIKLNHLKKVQQSKIQIEGDEFNKKVTSRIKYANESEIRQKQGEKSVNKDTKNANVSDTDKMVFQKKFKNFLNHREQFEAESKKLREKIIKQRKQRVEGNLQIPQLTEELLQDKEGQNQFQNASEMVAFYEQIALGKKNTKNRTQLYHAQKIEYLFRRQEFDYLILLQVGGDQRDHQNQLPTLVTSVKKDTLLTYLFNQPFVMMLYSINPYKLGDQLAQFQTKNDGFLTFEEFSFFLLLDREPTYFQYSKQNLQEAKKIGRGIKCLPIISKWIANTQIYDWLIGIFQQVDILGQQKVQKEVLARKIRKQAQKKRLLDQQVVQIVNINKLITLERLLYQIQFSKTQSHKITLQFFEDFLLKYTRLQTPSKDKLIKKLILSGKYDPSYIFILESQVIQIIKENFKEMQKFAEFFVNKQKFIQKVVKNEKYKKIKNFNVRQEGNKYVKQQNVQQTLSRIIKEGEAYLDIQQILDFFTNRGRPRKTQYQIYITNLQSMLKRLQQEQKLKDERKLSQGDYSTSSDQEQFQKSLKEKKIQRKKNKLAAIRACQNFEEGKKFSITVPNPFSFGLGKKQNTKTSIRQRKLKQMLEKKQRDQDESMVPIKPKLVPSHVQQNLYQKITREQQRDRKERLERFRLESRQKMYPISAHLLQKTRTQSLYYNVNQDYKFVAKPLPWYCQVNLLQRIQRQKQERRQKILQQIINKHSDYDLPQGVKKMIQRDQQRKQIKRERAESQTTANDPYCTFNPKITQSIPNFKVIHQHLQIDLQNKKQQKQAIKVIPFSFENRPHRSLTAPQSKKKGEINLKLSKKSQIQKQNNEEQLNIPMTMKYQALINLRRKQEEQKQRKLDQEKRASTVRKMRQQKFAPYVRSVLKNIEHTDISKSRAMIEQKIKQFKKEQRKRKREYQEQMIKIYTKVFNRPLLVQGDNIRNDTHNNQENEEESAGNEQDLNIKNERRKQQQKRRVQKSHERQQIQHFAEDYEMPYNAQDQRSNRDANKQYEQMRRKVIEHPPRNYLMEQPNGNQEEEGNNEDDYEGEYLSQNGRYTN